MPELPEVETIVREMRPKIVGKTFWKVDLPWPKVALPTAQFLEQMIVGRKVLDVTRKAKYIIVILDQDMRLVVHLRMTGRVMFVKSKDREKFIRAIFTFSDATQMFFSDVRKFGRIWLYHEKEFLVGTGMDKLGVDPFVDEFSLQILQKILGGGRMGILKNKLLDQTVIAGIGNIYADEICFRVGLHPSSRTENLTAENLSQIYEAILYCLSEGIKHNGASIQDFRGTRGDSGKHQKYLQVYGRTDDPCYRCGTPIIKTRVAGRGTFYCKMCQKLLE